jgi:putative spermidine/putrescine transport system permease protein
MTTELQRPDAPPTAPRPTTDRTPPSRRVSSFLTTHPRTRLALLLTAPLFWLVVVYIVALALLLVTAFWRVDPFTNEIVIDWTLDNIVTVVTGTLYQTVTLRTVGVALLVTLIDVAIALPIAFYMAKVASPRMQRILVIAVLMPLWASYLVKAYAWRSVLSQEGILEWMLAPFGLHTPGYGLPATVITLSYLWLPYVILPIYAGLERVPDSLLEASADLGGKTWRTLGSVVLPLVFPGDHRGHDLRLLAVAGRLHHRQHRGRREPDARQPDLRQHRRGRQSAARGGDRADPDRHHLRLPGPRASHGRPEQPLGRGMRLSTPARVILGTVTGLILLVVYLPLFVVLVNSFSTSTSLTWPPPGFTLEWWGKAFQSTGALDAVLTSVQVAIIATVIALVLGTLISFALQRFEFFGRDSISLLIILPIALPGIITGIALNNFFRTILGVPLSIWTVVIAHATFCIVTVFNNVIARLRRTGTSLEEASADLGAGVWTTFRLVTFPQLRSALLAGGMLAFALSFDEIIVTTFTAGSGVTTLPIFILNNMFRPNQAPIVSVIAVVLVLVSIVPIYLAQRLSGSEQTRR